MEQILALDIEPKKDGHTSKSSYKNKNNINSQDSMFIIKHTNLTDTFSKENTQDIEFKRKIIKFIKDLKELKGDTMHETLDLILNTE